MMRNKPISEMSFNELADVKKWALYRRTHHYRKYGEDHPYTRWCCKYVDYINSEMVKRLSEGSACPI